MKRLNVLVADDIPSDSELLHESLRTYAETRSGLLLHVDVAYDGKEAIEILKEYEQHGKPLHLLVTDQKMPNKKGSQVIEYMRASAHFKYVPAMVISTSSSQRDVDECWAAGGHGYVEKPDSWRDFQQLLHKIADFWLGDVLYPSKDVAKHKRSR